ncbi:hypothetical protein [Novosphingobium sp. M1R2S20]|uniref:Heat induced stress protein YflT n=1 Tax=Novosphingobium rhizovicinum TaxID=3228928 RepID=A0ABV3RF41_9SPHN
MTRNVASAIFDTRNEAEQAIQALRSRGVREKSISVISRHDSDFEHAHGNDKHEHTDTKASATGKGMAIGAGAGAVAGLAALAIPGVGPFIAAGAVAEALGLFGSAAATSAVVGGAIGGLTGALMKYGVDEEDARYFDERIQRGGYWVGVDLEDSGANRLEVEKILHEHRGHWSRSASRTTTL